MEHNNWNRNSTSQQRQQWREDRLQKMASRLQLNSERPRAISPSVLGYGNQRDPVEPNPRHYSENPWYNHQYGQQRRNPHQNYPGYNSNAPHHQFHRSDHRVENRSHGSYQQYGQRRAHHGSHKSLYSGDKKTSKSQRYYASTSSINKKHESEQKNDKHLSEATNTNIINLNSGISEPIHITNSNCIVSGKNIEAQSSVHVGINKHESEQKNDNNVSESIAAINHNSGSSEPTCEINSKSTVCKNIEAQPSVYADINKHESEQKKDNNVSESIAAINHNSGLSEPTCEINSKSTVCENIEAQPSVYVDINKVESEQKKYNIVSESIAINNNSGSSEPTCEINSKSTVCENIEAQPSVYVDINKHESEQKKDNNDSESIAAINHNSGLSEPTCEINSKSTVCENIEAQPSVYVDINKVEHLVKDTVDEKSILNPNEDLNTKQYVEKDRDVIPEASQTVFSVSDGMLPPEPVNTEKEIITKIAFEEEVKLPFSIPIITISEVASSPEQNSFDTDETSLHLNYEAEEDDLPSEDELPNASYKEQKHTETSIVEGGSDSISQEIENVENKLANISLIDENKSCSQLYKTPIKKNKKALIDATNILPASTIQYSIREVRKNDETEIIVTPVRRSSRLSTMTPVSKKNTCVRKLEELSPDIAQKFKLVPNRALDMPIDE